LPLEKIIYARDMNTDALVPKLMWAMARSREFAEIKRLVETPVRGDLLAHDAGLRPDPVSAQAATILEYNK
jgi:L-asparaginase